VGRTGDIAVFKIVAESAIGAGQRRIEALTGAGAKAWLDEQAGLARALADAMKVPVAEAPARLEALMDERRRLERELADARRKLAMGGGAAAPAGPEEVAGVKLVARVAQGVGGKDLRALIDQGKAQVGSGVVALIGVSEDGKAAVAVGVTDDLAGRIDARELVRAGAAAVGGKGGGGRPDMAQAGGPDGAKADVALAAIRAALASAA
jgi:alanyl-tRNA synthetase